MLLLTALHSVQLYAYDDAPVVEGHLLTLACKAKGPPGLDFVWRKDGCAIQVDHTTRNMWETRIRSDDKVTQTSILNIAKAQPFDEG